MGKFTLTDEQEKAFKKVISAMKKAQKTGLVIYAKQYDLVAYTREANDYIEENFEKSLATGFNQVENISIACLADSGADDYGCYRSQSDEDYFTKEDEE